MGVFIVSFNSSKWSTNAKCGAKYISRFGFSCSLHVASNCNRKLLSASMSQLHKMFLSGKTYGWLGIFTGMLLL